MFHVTRIVHDACIFSYSANWLPIVRCRKFCGPWLGSMMYIGFSQAQGTDLASRGWRTCYGGQDMLVLVDSDSRQIASEWVGNKREGKSTHSSLTFKGAHPRYIDLSTLAFGKCFMVLPNSSDVDTSRPRFALRQAPSSSEQVLGCDHQSKGTQ